MNLYTLSHLSDHTLLHDLAALVTCDRATTAKLLAHLAEVDARKLYLPAAYASMYAYCLGELHMSEETACRRIRAARAARDFPAIFAAVADGRLHLSAVVLLAPYLTVENAAELLEAATHNSKSEIERLLANRFPRPDVPTRLEAISSTGSSMELPSPVTVESEQLAPGPVAAAERPRVAPLAPERFALQVTIDRATHDKLRHAQALLSHQVPAGDVAKVLELVLDTAIEQLEKRKFAATCRPRGGQRPSSASGRHVPSEVRRAVWQRDGGRCTFVSDSGQRCAERRLLEFDHVQELARGGVATISGMRLRCRAHNQYTAERTFGAEFMRQKRERARRAAEPRAKTAADSCDERDVTPWLRQLGFSVQDARRAAAHCESVPDASLEARVRAALVFLTPAHRRPRIPGAAG